MKTPPPSPLRWLAMSALLTITTLTASSAAAKGSPQDLVSYLPASSRVVMGGDAVRSRGTAAFDEAMKLLRERGADALKLMDEQLGFRIERDLYAGVLGLPASRNGKPSSKTFTMVLQGKINADLYKKNVLNQPKAKKRQVGKLTVIDGGKNSEVALINESTVVIARGSKKYRDSVWKVAQGQGKSASKDGTIRGLLKGVNGKSHAWVVANMARVKQSEQAPQLRTIVANMDLSAGLKLRSLVSMKSEEDATRASKTMEESRLKAKLMMMVYGADALIDNLKVSQAKSALTINTSMNEDQLRRMAQALKAPKRANPPKPSGSAPKAQPEDKPKAP